MGLLLMRILAVVFVGLGLMVWWCLCSCDVCEFVWFVLLW